MKQAWLKMSKAEILNLDPVNSLNMATGLPKDYLKNMKAEDFNKLQDKMMHYHFLNNHIKRSIPLSMLQFTSEAFLEEWLLESEIESFSLEDIIGFIEYLKNNKDDLSEKRIEVFALIAHLMNYLTIDFITV